MLIMLIILMAGIIELGVMMVLACDGKTWQEHDS